MGINLTEYITKFQKLDRLALIHDEQEDSLERMRAVNKKLFEPIFSARLKTRSDLRLIVRLPLDTLTFQGSYNEHIYLRAKNFRNPYLLLLENIERVIASMKRRISRYDNWDDRRRIIRLIIDTCQKVSQSIDTVCVGEEIDMGELIKEVVR